MTIAKPDVAKTGVALFLLACGIAVLLGGCATAFKSASPQPQPSDAAVSSTGAKPMLGIGFKLEDVAAYTQGDPQWGYQVTLLLPSTAAAAAGIQRGDYLLAFDRQTLDPLPPKMRATALKAYVDQRRVGDRIQLELLRRVSEIRQAGVSGRDVWRPLQAADIDALLTHSDYEEEHQLRIRHRWRRWQATAVLGSRENLETELPPNESLGRLDAAGETPVTRLAQQLLAEHDLTQRQAQLFQVFDRSERWDDGRRLDHFRYLHRNPHRALPLLERLTDDMQRLAQQEDWLSLLAVAGGWLDLSVPLPKPIPHPDSKRLDDHIAAIRQVLEQAHALRQQGLARLNERELKLLSEALPPLLERFSNSLYINRGISGDDRVNFETLAALDQIDLVALHQSAMTLLWFADNAWLKNLQAALAEQALAETEFATAAGRALIGGTKNHIYRKAAALQIDFGGDDTYAFQAESENNGGGIRVIVDLEGDDSYAATDAHGIAGAQLGVNLLFDMQGSDSYQSVRFGQASAVGGVALFIDRQGDDSYAAQQFAQGFALFGTALFVDGKGDDHYQGQQYLQGVGAPMGFGALLDLSGDDRYYSSGGNISSYGNSGIFKGLGQGLGVGFRGYASGGIGLLLDGAGNDRYRAGNFAQAAGYFYGLGVLRDRQGDDEYFGSRYGQAAAAHQAGGVLIDDAGDDRYQGWSIALQSAAWDESFAALWDKAGDDRYGHSPNTFSIGAVAHDSFSLFVDAAGDDCYVGKHRARSKEDEYDLQMFFDFGGNDCYQASKPYGNSKEMATETGIFYDKP